MRVLFAVSPGLHHFHPLVGLAWVFRTAGHSVLVAASGAAVQGAAHSGLTVRDVSPGTDFTAVSPATGNREERLVAMRERGLKMAATLETPDAVLKKAAQVSDVMADGLTDLATSWRPDLIVYSRLQGAALVAARALGVPAVEHGINLLREGALPGRFLKHLEQIFDRLGVPVELPSLTSLYIAPGSMLRGRGEGLDMRSVPFHGGGLLTDRLARPKRRPRICVTLGSSVPGAVGPASLSAVLGAASRMDAEFLLALGDAPDLGALGTLPRNVRALGWTPLGALLESCEGIIHHGGSRTTLASAHAGVPQLILPHGDDNWINSSIVEECEIGLRADPGRTAADLVGQLLDDDDLRTRSREFARTLAAHPGPGQMVPRLLDVADLGHRNFHP